MENERTNVWNGEFSPTGIESAFCYRKFYLRKLLGLERNRPPIALKFGGAIHKGVETFYVLKSQIPFEEAKMRAVEAFAVEWASAGLNGDDKRDAASGIIIMNNYCEYYKDDHAEISPEFVESQQWIEMPNGTHMLFKIDRTRLEGDRKIVVDTKTSSWPLTDFFFQGYQNALQTSLYYYGVDKILDGCDGIQIDGIKVPPPKEGSATQPFARRTFIRTELQIADAVNTWCRMTDYIMEGINKYGEEDQEALAAHMYCNQSKCNDYGGCEFRPICTYGFDHPTVQVDFTRKDTRNEN